MSPNFLPCWTGFGAVATSPVSTFVEISFDSWGWVGIVASGIEDLSWCLKFKNLFCNFAFWSSPRFVRYRRLSILFWARCISEIGGGNIRVCCLRYQNSSWEILFSSKPLSNLSSPGKTFVCSLHLSRWLEIYKKISIWSSHCLFVLFDKPSSFTWMHLLR